MNKLIIILAWLISYKKTVKLGDIKYILDKKTMEKTNTIDKKYLKWNKEQKKIKNVITNGGYDQNNNPPIITKDNICIDGHHRLFVLKQTQKDDFRVKVKKIWLLNWVTFHKEYQKIKNNG